MTVFENLLQMFRLNGCSRKRSFVFNEVVSSALVRLARSIRTFCAFASMALWLVMMMGCLLRTSRSAVVCIVVGLSVGWFGFWMFGIGGMAHVGVWLYSIGSSSAIGCCCVTVCLNVCVMLLKTVLGWMRIIGISRNLSSFCWSICCVPAAKRLRFVGMFVESLVRRMTGLFVWWVIVSVVVVFVTVGF